MSEFADYCICELYECGLFLENPIFLPCGSTICKEHVENDSKTFNCDICKEEHLIPEKGFPINKFAHRQIEDDLYLNKIQMEIKHSYEKLEKKLKEHENLNSENLIYDYYSNIRNQVDLHREQLIEQINKNSEEIIKQLKEMEEKCKLNAANLVKMNLDKLINKDMNEYKYQLRQPYLKDYDLNILYSDINDMIDDIQQDINNFKNESLTYQNIQFQEENSNLFGELKVEEIQKPIKAEAKRAEGTLRFLINDFSKFKESGEGRYSEDKCILRGLEWRIKAKPTKLEDGTFAFGYYLRCEDKNHSKKFPIWAKFTGKLLHLNNPDKNRTKSKKIINFLSSF
jgi:hypothetical protein